MNNATPLGCLQSIPEFLETPEGEKLFGSRNAVDWFNRVNKAALVSNGALVKVRNQWKLLRPQYDQIVIEIAKSNAQKGVSL